MELYKEICFWIIQVLGVGGLLWLLLWVWDHAFTRLANFFNIKKDFVDFMVQKYRSKNTRKSRK